MNLVERNPWLCCVEQSYLDDNFNLYGLSNEMEDYPTVLKVVRGEEVEDAEDLQDRAEVLYGLIHARYLLTFHGIKELQPKYRSHAYGTCPRVACNEQPLLPIGLSPTPGACNVKTYCPCCEDLYDTDIQLDGAFFGPYCAHFFLQALKGDIIVESKVSTTFTFMGIPIAPDSEMNPGRYVHGAGSG
jgi:casein kinase II subunit beta